jgi:GTP 3',8-cyclase
VPNGYESVLAGVRAARQAGLDPVKINCVLLRGFNEDQVIPFGMFAREERVVVRFIEFMPLEEDRVWTPEIVVTLDEIVSRMSEYLPLEEIGHERSETARRYRFRMAWARLELLRRCRIRFAGTAAGFALPPTASCARVCFLCGITTCTS